ncbi:MAG: hypothetical protein GTN65_14190, partial [Armatimonadetes bacterium]|nr:hypothetical protein [Armatimonadota bacterium]NIO98210.1 hypothetical protein [Armatimonadota bacterium]
MFGAIPERVNFTFIADCCHSGSIQRVPLGRDQELEFEPRYLNPPPEVTKRIAEGRNKRGAAFDSASAAELLALLEGVPEAQRAEKVEEYFAQARSRLAENKYGFVSVDQHALLAACQDRQTAADARIEGDFRGAFTWGLSQAIKQSN